MGNAQLKVGQCHSPMVGEGSILGAEDILEYSIFQSNIYLGLTVRAVWRSGMNLVDVKIVCGT